MIQFEYIQIIFYGDYVDGIINVLKPPGMTSHDVVGALRRLFKLKRIGHTGTLDPDACGVLPICVGKATKVVDYLTDKTKRYRAQLVLGITTDTEDASGKVIETKNVDVSQEEILNIVQSFVGDIEQIPPMYSAIKMDGKKLYQLAREGVTVKREPRKIKIFGIQVVSFDENKVFFDVECSKGTYIRTLCKDIGEKLGCGGHMGFLLRMSAGSFNIEESFTLDEISDHYNNGNVEQFLIPTDKIFEKYKAVTVKNESLKWILNGAQIYAKDMAEKDTFVDEEIIRVYDTSGNFLALYKMNNEDKVKFVPETMFI